LRPGGATQRNAVRTVRNGIVEIAAAKPPSANTGTVVSATIDAKFLPSERRAPGCVGVANSGPSTAKSSLQLAARSISARVWHDARREDRAGATSPRGERSPSDARRRTPSHAPSHVAVVEHFRAARARERHELLGATQRCRSIGHVFSRNWIKRSPRSSATCARVRKLGLPSSSAIVIPVHARQRSARAARRVRGQERRHVETSRDLPLEFLAIVPDRLARPIEHAEKVQLDVRVRIAVALHEPRRGAAHVDAELLGELAVERVARRSRRLELAAGKFPVAAYALPRGRCASSTWPSAAR
jgi:hypothetical protein